MATDPYVEQLLSTLPNALAAELRQALTSTDEDYTRALEQRLRTTEAKANAALVDVYPADITDVAIVKAALQSTQSIALAYFGADRPLWAAGIFGRCRTSNPQGLTIFLDAAAEWSFCRLLLNTATDIGEGVLGVELIAKAEYARRVLLPTVQFQWISQLQFEAAARVSKTGNWIPKLGFLTAHSIGELFDYVNASWTTLNTFQDHSTAWLAMSQDTRDLCSALARSQTNPATLEAAFSSTGADDKPLISILGVVVPGVRRVLAHSLESALWAAVRDNLGGTQFGDWFELVAAESLASVAPYLQLVPQPTNVRISKADPGQVDFALRGPSNDTVIGEVKGYAIPSEIASLQNAFSSLKDAAKQLQKRISALSNGSPLIGNKKTYATKRVVGLGITLHTYAGALWRSQSVKEIDQIRTDRALLPLSQAMLVLACLESYNELAAYIALRQEMLRKNLFAEDEFDILMLITSPDSRTTINRIPSTPAAVLPLHIVDYEYLAQPRPARLGHAWRADLQLRTKRITSLPQEQP